ncbi:SubName: Full=Related to Adiponectin receptor 1 {ECO:0000313/EMBL:CCA71959.1} [Serendipita indica DSM 11827]|nr:SubName: Full=Related to Adiponectin receptor 1 {ECO:0000313/EMBL:CCA71959.1} [Serendipita indica DSM 11827]
MVNQHNKHPWITYWLVIATVLVLWDAGFCFMRPHSFQGGKYHWIWKPYALYQNIDLVYGVEAHRRGDGFTNAQSFLNVVETIGNLLYLYKAQGSDPITPLIGFTVATMSFSKTVLYWAQEYFCNYCAVGHNDPWTLFFLWIIPNGTWLIFPLMVMVTLGKDILNSLRVTNSPRRTAYANGKHD